MSDKRKKHAAGFKAKVALDALRERESVREISTRHGVHSTQVNLWKAQLRDSAAGIFEHPSGKTGKLPDREAELFEQIGRLKMELEWLKKRSPIPTADLRALVDPGGRFPVACQCALLGLPRSSYYYRPATESPENLGLMRMMDEEHTDHPFLGVKTTALFTIRRSGCVPAEPYPPNRTNRVAPGGRLCYSFNNLRCANGRAQTRNTSRFYILAKPFCCPAHGEPLTPCE